MESWCANRQRSSESTTGGTLYVSSYGAVYSPFLGAGLQYWRRFVEMAARSEVAVVGGELPWHNLWTKEIWLKGKQRKKSKVVLPCNCCKSRSKNKSVQGDVVLLAERQHLVIAAAWQKNAVFENERKTSAVSASVSQPLKKRLLPPCSSSSSVLFTNDSNGLRLVATKWDPTAWT